MSRSDRSDSDILSVTASRRRRAPRRAHDRARRRRDAGVHAGRHAGRRQGHDAARPRGGSAPRSSSATPITCICGPATTSSRVAAGCTASSAGRARSSPTAAAIRSSASPRAARSTKRACDFQSHLDGSRASADAGVGRRHPGAARLRHRDGARRVPGAAGAAATRCDAVGRLTRALGAARRRDRLPRTAAARRSEHARPGAVRHRAGRHFAGLRATSAELTRRGRVRGLRDRRAQRRRAERR